MNYTEEQFEKLTQVRLPEEVRVRMRAELLSYAELHAPTALTSTARASWTSFFVHTSYKVYGSLAAFVLIIGGLGGTAYASEDSLPGDTLYTVKTKISEPIQVALATTVEDKAEKHAAFAERRLEEAVTLAAQDRLSDEVQATIATNLEMHLAESSENAEKLQEEGNELASLDVRSDLEARLTAHEQILTVMSSHFAGGSDTASDTTSESVTKLLAVVEQRRTEVQQARLALQDALLPDAPVVASVAATSTVTLARVEEPRPVPRALPAAETEVVDDVVQVDIARTEEVAAILSKHAPILAAFITPDEELGDTATSTATTTATTTEMMASSTPEQVEEDRTTGRESVLQRALFWK